MIRAALAGVFHPHALVRAELLRSDQRVRLVGFVEDDDALASDFARVTGVPRLASLELLSGLDLVVVESPDPSVAKLARRLAPHVRALLLEKPGGASLNELGALVVDLEPVPVAVHVGYELHHSRAVELTRRALSDGSLGEVTLARFHCAAPAGCGAEQWQSLRENRGGTLFTIGSHMLELVVAVLGMPATVSATVARLPLSGPVTSTTFKTSIFGVEGTSTHRVGDLVHEDAAAAVLRFGTLLASFDLTAWEGADWLETWSMEFVGTKGVLRVRPNPASVELTPHGAQPVHLLTPPPDTGVPAARSMVVDPTYVAEMDAVLRELEEGAPPSKASLRRALDVMRLLEAFYRSSEEQRAVTLADIVPESAGGARHG